MVYMNTDMYRYLNVKVAILELVAACVDHQPGLTQLLLDINPGVSLVVEPAPVLSAQLAGKRNCEHILVLTHLKTLSDHTVSFNIC
jgi:hypothetical protein